MQNRFLNETFKRLCQENQISFESLCLGWIIRIQKEEVTRYIHGYHFDLNADTASLIAQDKYATGSILRRENIPVLDQTYFLKMFEDEFFTKEQILEKVSHYTFPMICKPNLGSGGHDIVLVHSPQELESAVRTIHLKERGVLVSEFQKIETEYRVVVLDDEVLLTYGKKAPDGDLRHNLSSGATAVLSLSEETQNQLSDLARRSMRAINLTFGTVDIIEIQKRGGGVFQYEVLEINSGVCLEHFSDINKECKEKAEGIYRKVFDMLFNRTES